jgi:transcription elongation GreA/GreB family factor
LERVGAVTREEVTSDETRSEGKYDTRSTEASYLARGQAWRITSLRQLSAWFQALPDEGPASNAPVCLGALVAVEAERVEFLFLAPVGGSQVEVDGHRVRVISPDSPLGKKLIGRRAGEDFAFERPSGKAEFSLLAVG